MVVQLSPHPLSHTLTLVLSLTSSSWTRSKRHSPHHPATQWSHVLGPFHSHLPSYHMHTHTHPYPPNTHPHTKMYIHCNSHTTISHHSVRPTPLIFTLAQSICRPNPDNQAKHHLPHRSNHQYYGDTISVHTISAETLVLICYRPFRRDA